MNQLHTTFFRCGVAACAALLLALPAAAQTIDADGQSARDDLAAPLWDPFGDHGPIDPAIIQQVLEQVKAGAVAAATFTDEAEFLATVAESSTVQEGFEDEPPWDAVRSTISGGTNAAASVTNRGITWTSNHPDNEITTSSGAAHTGGWGIYSVPHGDQTVPSPTDFIEDGIIGTSDQPLVAVGGWFQGTAGGDLDVILDGDEANPIGLGPVDATPAFYGVVADSSFSSFEFRETEGTLEDQKLVFLDDVTVAMADGVTVPTMDGVVAGVANLPGAMGSDWHSDLYLHNAGAVQATVELYFTTSNGTLGDPATVTVGPDQTLVLEDAVASVFGDSGSGAVSWRVIEGDPSLVVVNANTYNRVDDVQRYGQQIPGVRWDDAAPVGSRVLVPALAARYRTNLGFATDGDCSTVVIRGYDQSSRLVAQQWRAVQPWAWIQLNSLFRQVFPQLIEFPDLVTEAYSLHRFEVIGLDGRVVAYTSIIDNTTNDGSYMAGKVPGGVGDQWLPGAAAILGANDSDWRSDVVFVSGAGAPDSAVVSFFPGGQDSGSSPEQRTLPLAIGQSVFEGNILSTLFGYSPPAVGSLMVATAAEAPLLWMRTYTEEPGAERGTVTYGQAIMGRAAADTIGAGAEGRVAGFNHDDVARANLILQNTRSTTDGFLLFTTVRVELLASDGAVQHDKTYLLDPGEYRQFNRFVDDIGVGPVRGASVRVTVLDAPESGVVGGVDAMVSEVNGNILDGTNDGRLVRAEVVTASPSP